MLLELVGELLDAVAPGSAHGLIGGRDDCLRLAARCSGFSTGIATIVVQLGLATMPWES